MEEKNAQWSDQGHPRVRDYNPQGGEWRGDEGGKPNGGDSRVRFIDEPREQQGDGAGRERQARQQITEPATEVWSFASAFAASSYDAFQTMAWMMLSWQREMAGFMAMRIGKDMEYGRRLCGTHHLSQLIRLNSDYARELVSDYASSVRSITEQALEEAQERGTHAVRRAQDTAGHLRASAERAADR